MERQDIVVLGSGLTGCYAAYKTGGLLVPDDYSYRRYNSSKRSHYIFLRYSPKNRGLLKELNIDFNRFKFKIGYKKGEDILDKPNKAMIKALNNKAYGANDFERLLELNRKEMCSVDYTTLYNNLYGKVSDSTAKKCLKKIDLFNKKIIIADNTEISYNKLISTIPLDNFINRVTTSNRNSSNYGLKVIPTYYYKAEDIGEYNQILDMNEGNKTLRFLNDGVSTIEESTEKKRGCLFENKYGRIAESGARYEKEFRHNIDVVDYIKKIKNDGVYLAGRLGSWYPFQYTEISIEQVDNIAGQ
jgi:hypothetical protein